MAVIREEDFVFIKASHHEHTSSQYKREEVLGSEVLSLLIMSLPTNGITLENSYNISLSQLPQLENGNNHPSSAYFTRRLLKYNNPLANFNFNSCSCMHYQSMIKLG